MGRTFFHMFERASGQKVEVAYEATVHSSSTEVYIKDAWDDATQKPVTLTDHERDDYETYIAEHHLGWI